MNKLMQGKKIKKENKHLLVPQEAKCAKRKAEKWEMNNPNNVFLFDSLQSVYRI